jgi:uncharacterized protein involved in cysteine biosynthesis
VLLTGVGVSYTDELMGWLSPELTQEGWMGSVLAWLSGLMIALLSFLVTPFLVVLVGLPLCEPLASRAHELMGGAEVEVPLIESFMSGLTLSLKVAVIALSGGLALLALGMIPPFTLIAGPFTLLIWAPFWLCFDLCEVVHTRAHLSFAERARQLRGSLLSTASVGLVAGLLIAPPFFNLLGFPIAVLMGTLHARELELKGS